MNTLKAIFTLLPTIISALIGSVHELENGFKSIADATGNPTAGAGEQKLSVIQAILQTVYDTEKQVADAVPFGLLSGIISAGAKALVSAFNALGYFKKA